MQAADPRRDETRPWGRFEVLDVREGLCIKRIEVLPGERLSLQRHALRDEHWYVVQGMAHVTLGTQVLALASGQSLDIPRGTWHRVANESTGLLVLIEVQTGTDCRESDIERAEDDYGRVSPPARPA